MGGETMRSQRRQSRASRQRRAPLSVEALESRLVPSLIPRPSHVVLVIEENHDYGQIIGSPNAPYINSLAQQSALITNSFAITHPSQPNYLDLFSGSNQGVTDDSYPHSFSAANLASELSGAGFSFGGYSESMPFVGFTGSSYQGLYYAKHNPWVDFSNVPPWENMPLAGYFPANFAQLPTVSIVVPNIADDMHTGTVQQGDAWLQANLSGYVQWARANNSLLIVTWDEDADANNHIPTLFFGPMITPGAYNLTINHFNVLRTVEDMYGLPHAGASAGAAPITYIWQIDNENFVQSLYNDFLGRSGSLTEIDGWVAAIPQLDRAGVARGIALSPEAFSRIVDSAYQRFLNRPADAAGEQAWVGFLESGRTEEQFLSTFLAAPEFANQANGLIGSSDANNNFVRALYNLLLNRDAADAEVNFWLSALPRLGRNGVAVGILGSPEYRSAVVRNLYGDPSLQPFPFEPFFPDLLKRSSAPQPGEVAHWTNQALDTFSLEAGFAESEEYFVLAQ
jgi:acid phosphatase